ncbi:ATP-dependent DNA helicase RecQ-like [Hydractinia symbiolongicarpus]|uniref:ATP-dependent DNA helicase RecQ-like n=1 Tax=Hydractinia symbiolongicarpus TaxID=13093 RepID=UPI0025513BDC|nr:ATP-dependent DNA helicase RecQ-like [Hydractinia symbiolongicarpus]
MSSTRVFEVLNRIQVALGRNSFPDMNFKPKQIKCSEAILKGRDVLAVLPTGYWKSIIFQLLPDFLSNEEKGSMIIVITSLNSIIDDQMKFLKKVGMECFHLKSPFDIEEARTNLFSDSYPDNEVDSTALPDFSIKKFKILFCHPEAILSDVGRNLLKTNTLQKVVDEAHCIDTWGDSFRKEFLNLGAITSFFLDIPVLALTATSTVKTTSRIKSVLGMRDCIKKILLPIGEDLKKQAKAHPQTIIYCKLKYCGYGYKLFESIIGPLQYVGGECKPSKSLFVQFHAPQTKHMKHEIISEISKIDSNIRVIFATSALGMGVNAPNMKQIVHIGPPPTLEEYMQEIGRAGCRGQDAVAVLHYNNSDMSAVIIDFVA